MLYHLMIQGILLQCLLQSNGAGGTQPWRNDGLVKKTVDKNGRARVATRLRYWALQGIMEFEQESLDLYNMAACMCKHSLYMDETPNTN